MKIFSAYAEGGKREVVGRVKGGCVCFRRVIERVMGKLPMGLQRKEENPVESHQAFNTRLNHNTINVPQV